MQYGEKEYHNAQFFGYIYKTNFRGRSMRLLYLSFKELYYRTHVLTKLHFTIPSSLKSVLKYMNTISFIESSGFKLNSYLFNPFDRES